MSNQGASLQASDTVGAFDIGLLEGDLHAIIITIRPQPSTGQAKVAVRMLASIVEGSGRSAAPVRAMTLDTKDDQAMLTTPSHPFVSVEPCTPHSRFPQAKFRHRDAIRCLVLNLDIDDGPE